MTILESGPNQPLREARRRRAETMLAVEQGLITIWDVFQQAVTDRAVRKLRLRQLLASAYKWPLWRANQAIDHVYRVTTRDPNGHAPDKADVAWLLDNRSGGGRYRALADFVLRPVEEGPPWPGFPFREVPDE